MKELRSRFPMYAKLLYLYPAPYRERYGEEILLTTADMLDEAATPASKILIWSHIAIDLPINIGRQQFSYVGGIMTNETPQYVKRNSMIAGVLLLPFIGTLIANALSKMVTNQTLYHTWLWKLPTLGVWVLYLPEVALLVTLATYIAYVTRKREGASQSLARRALDIRHMWPVMLPALLAFGILFLVAFHDSVQCWAQHPVHAATHVGQAWQCTAKNQSLRSFTRL